MAPKVNDEDLFNNFVTPLAGTFLNLPKEPCVIQCPSCGIKEKSKVETEQHRNSWTRIILSRVAHGCFCCCCEADCRVPCYSPKPNHYCVNCGCYFGQSSRKDKLDLTTK